ncbi:MAG: aminopeptidase P family protein [Ignavibacteriaceae bacterium]
MFDSKIYVKRRNVLKKNLKSGLIILPGNDEAAMNYAANTYRYRQDSSFLYYFGPDFPGLTGIIDIDEDEEILFGNDFSIDDIVWMGPQKTIKQLAELSGVKNSLPLKNLQEKVSEAINNGRKIHFLPQYRFRTILMLSRLLGYRSDSLNNYTSTELIKAVIDQRSVKAPEEIRETDYAVDIAYEMHTYAMRMTRAGLYERDVAGAIEGIALSMGNGVSFPVIFSINGQTLHNHSHDNLMREGHMVVNDSGAESLLHYASDITRTFPVSGVFTEQQKNIYEIVLKAQLSAIKSVKPGIKYRDIHLKAAKVIAKGLTELGIMKGDPALAVKEGAHALFFPHGLGHMMGLDVHDLEGLGENFVGYDEKTKRSDQFGLAYLRLAKKLEPGFVLTVEPGIYFIPELIDMWKSEGRHKNFINYDELEKYRKLGGVRIEDDVVVEKSGSRVLGSNPIPKTISEVEEICASL